MGHGREGCLVSRVVSRLGVGLVAAAVATPLACSGSDGAATPVESSHGNESDEDGGSRASSGSSGGDDGHVRRADSGCIIHTAGPLTGTTVESVPRPDAPSGLAWGSLDLARDADDAVATISLDEGQETEHLRITGFGFSVPASADVTGVVVELRRQGSDTGIADGLIELTFDGGRVSGRPKYMEAAWPRAIIGAHNYGAPEDRWGNDVFPADVNHPSFGVEIWAKRQSGVGSGPLEGRVDSMRIYVHYCEE